MERSRSIGILEELAKEYRMNQMEENTKVDGKIIRPIEKTYPHRM